MGAGPAPSQSMGYSNGSTKQIEYSPPQESDLRMTASSVTYVILEVNNLRGEGDSWWKSARDRLNQLYMAQHRSVVVVHQADIGGGFSWWTYDFVAMSFFDSVHLNALSILAHEPATILAYHTHSIGYSNAREAEDYILSARPIDELDGDRTVIDDTPPDPYIENLHGDTAIQAIALDQHVFQQPGKNIMSYRTAGQAISRPASAIAFGKKL